MPLLRFMAILAFGTVLSWAAWLVTVFRLDPYTDGTFAVALFMISAFLAVSGTLTIIGFFLRYWLEEQKIIFRQFAVAGRQALVLTSGLAIVAGLQLGSMLHLWSAILVLMLVIIVELFFQAGEHRRQLASTNHAAERYG